MHQSGTGRMNRKPWATSQPMLRSASSCPAVSTPSATMRRLRARPESDDHADELVGVLLLAEPFHERAVDLQDVHREPREVGQRRVAGPEVVDREPHAELPQLAQQRHRLVHPFHQDGLGDLEHQRLGGEPGLGEHPAHVVDQPLVQLTGGDVDADVEGVRGRAGLCGGRVLPAAGGPAGLGQHPRAELADEPDLLGDADEPVGRDEAALRVTPAQQGLGADQSTRRDVPQRLVDDGQLPVGRREPEVVLDLRALGQLGEHPGLETHPGAGRTALRLVHGEVGLAEEGVGVADPRGADGEADAGADVRGAVRQWDRLGDERGDPLGDLHRDLLDVRTGQQHGELVTTEAGDRVVRPDALREPGRDHLEQVIAGGVPLHVVDGLEAVEVAEQQGDARRGVRPCCRRACSTRAWNSTRFGRPVRASEYAWRVSAYSSRFRSPTSRIVTTKPWTCGSCRRAVTVTSDGTHCPRKCRKVASARQVRSGSAAAARSISVTPETSVSASSLVSGTSTRSRDA